jgi:hypothetical protein
MLILQKMSVVIMSKPLNLLLLCYSSTFSLFKEWSDYLNQWNHLSTWWNIIWWWGMSQDHSLVTCSLDHSFLVVQWRDEDWDVWSPFSCENSLWMNRCLFACAEMHLPFEKGLSWIVKGGGSRTLGQLSLQMDGSRAPPPKAFQFLEERTMASVGLEESGPHVVAP